MCLIFFVTKEVTLIVENVVDTFSDLELEFNGNEKPVQREETRCRR